MKHINVATVVMTTVAYQFGLTLKEIKDSSTLEDLGADSLDIIDIFMCLEEDLKIDISVEQAAALQTNIKTVGELIHFFTQIKYPYTEKIMVADKPKNHHKRWTEIDESILILSYAAGTSLHMIAKSMGRTKISILDRLRIHGLVTFDKEAKAYYSVPSLLYKFD